MSAQFQNNDNNQHPLNIYSESDVKKLLNDEDSSLSHLEKLNQFQLPPFNHWTHIQENRLKIQFGYLFRNSMMDVISDLLQSSEEDITKSLWYSSHQNGIQEKLVHIYSKLERCIHLWNKGKGFRNWNGCGLNNLCPNCQARSNSGKSHRLWKRFNSVLSKGDQQIFWITLSSPNTISSKGWTLFKEFLQLQSKVSRSSRTKQKNPSLGLGAISHRTWKHEMTLRQPPNTLKTPLEFNHHIHIALSVKKSFRDEGISVSRFTSEFKELWSDFCHSKSNTQWEMDIQTPQIGEWNANAVTSYYWGFAKDFLPFVGSEDKLKMLLKFDLDNQSSQGRRAIRSYTSGRLDDE